MKGKNNDVVIEIPQAALPIPDLNQIDFSFNTLTNIKKNIDVLTKRKPKPKSFFTNLAALWGEIHWITKGIILFTILIPIILIAIYTQILFILSAAVVTSFIYIGISLILDNHYNIEGGFKDENDKRTGALVDFFGLILNKLWGVGHGLQREVGEFNAQNQILTTEVQSFTLENANFKTQIEKLTKESERLSKHCVEFESIVSDLEQKVQEQEQIIKQERDLQSLIQKEHVKTNTQLEAQSTILSINVQALKLKLNHFENNEILLRNAIQQLVGINARSDQSSIEFSAKLNAILQKVEDQFVNFALELHTISEKFNAALARLNEGNEKQENLLIREAENLQVLEVIVDCEKRKQSHLVKQSVFKERNALTCNRVANTSDIVISVC